MHFAKLDLLENKQDLRKGNAAQQIHTFLFEGSECGILIYIYIHIHVYLSLSLYIYIYICVAI